MKEVVLTILAKDFAETDYSDAFNCAMTRALQRAGIDAREIGGTLRHNLLPFTDIPTPLALKEPVREMYAYADKLPDKRKALKLQWASPGIEPADFSFKLSVPDAWVVG